MGQTVRHASKRLSRALLIRPQRIGLIYVDLSPFDHDRPRTQLCHLATCIPEIVAETRQSRYRLRHVAARIAQDRNLLQSSISSVQRAATLMSNFVRVQVPA